MRQGLWKLISSILALQYILIIFQNKMKKGIQNIPTNQQNLNIMIRESLPSKLKKKYWIQISRRDHQFFLNSQTDIMISLLNNRVLFAELFSKFYNNHVHINNWYMLAHQNQSQLKKYVFKRLLSKSLNEYKEGMKQNKLTNVFNKTILFRNDILAKKQKNNESFHTIHIDGLRNNKTIDLQLFGSADPKKEMKTSIYERDIKKQRNDEIAQASAEMKNNEQKEIIEKEDYHDLFVRTFNACDGSKYILYDFNKHMKGIQSKKKYNAFIRTRKPNNFRSSINFKICWINQESEDQFYLNSRFNSTNPPDDNNQFNYFYQKENQIENNTISKFVMSPIGTTFKNQYKRQLIASKKIPTIFRKHKSHHLQKSLLFIKFQK